MRGMCWSDLWNVVLVVVGIEVFLVEECRADDLVKGPFTCHFQRFLKKNEGTMRFDYGGSLMDKAYLNSYGGKADQETLVNRIPVIFIHGNSDLALDLNDGIEYHSGWSRSIAYFLGKGYKTSELYAFTYGDRNLTNAANRQHTCTYLQMINKFIFAVLKYTNSTQVDIIAHSMGVTLTKRAIIGHTSKDATCSVGRSLKNKVRTLIAIAGASHGLCMCNQETSVLMKACGKDHGFYSGSSCNAKFEDGDCSTVRLSQLGCTVKNYSTFLKGLTAVKWKVADKIVSIWSNSDEVTGHNNFVWGKKTSHLPGSDTIIVLTNATHHGLKMSTPEIQYLELQ
uniref:Lipase n=1 Tax=Rhabditophanes sp. KR3021 TaxID=114890 RepID=A0AC35TVS2_9BILA